MEKGNQNKICDGSRKFETKSVMERENWKQKEQVYLVSWGLPGSVGGRRNQVKGRIMPQLFTPIKLFFRFF